VSTIDFRVIYKAEVYCGHALVNKLRLLYYSDGVYILMREHGKSYLETLFEDFDSTNDDEAVAKAEQFIVGLYGE